MGRAVVKLDNALRGVKKLGLDSTPFIYFIEKEVKSLPSLRVIFSRIQDKCLEGITSTVALTETLVAALRDTDEKMAQYYRNLLLETEVQTVPVSVEIAEEAARLRATYNLKTPDALMIATALSVGCQAFLTNDEALRRIGEVRVLILKELL